MTLDQLRVFVAVAERQHVTRAAEALHLAQSAVSAAIAALEARHGVKLFHRAGRGITLTDAGVLFLDEARAVLARAEGAELALAELGGLKRGTIALQASQTIASYWLPRHLVAFRRAHPGIEIRLSIGNTAQAAEAVLAGAADLGFVEGELDAPRAGRPAASARDQLVIVTGASHPWTRQRHVAPHDLLQSDWVLREPGSGTRSVFEAALAGFGLAPSRSARGAGTALQRGPCVRPWRRGWALRHYPPRSPRPAWRRACSTRWRSPCRSGISSCCSIRGATAAGRRRRWLAMLGVDA